MPGKKHMPEAIAEAVRQIGATEVSCYRWRQEYSGLKLDQVKRLRVLAGGPGCASPRDDEASSRPDVLRTGSPPFPPLRLIHSTAQRLPRFPRSMGPGPPCGDYCLHGTESRFRNLAYSLKQASPALVLTGHSRQSTASLLWSRLTGRCLCCWRLSPRAWWSTVAPPCGLILRWRLHTVEPARACCRGLRQC